MTLGERLRSLREKAGFTQKELANRLKVPNQNISNYERDFRQPDYETLQRLADFYDVSIDYLLGRSDKATYKGILISEEDIEMLKFFKDPETGLFFKEMKEAPADQLEEMRQIWEVLKRRGLK